MGKSIATQRAKLKQQKAKAEKEIYQLQNKQKILLNRLRKEERNARTSRLCRHGAILEGVFPGIITEDGESVKAFLIALSRLPGARELEEKMLNGGGPEYRDQMKPCVVCGASFVPKSNRAKYCSDCAITARRKKEAERQRKRYFNSTHLGGVKPL